MKISKTAGSTGVRGILKRGDTFILRVKVKGKQIWRTLSSKNLRDAAAEAKAAAAGGKAAVGGKAGLHACPVCANGARAASTPSHRSTSGRKLSNCCFAESFI